MVKPPIASVGIWASTNHRKQNVNADRNTVPYVGAVCVAMSGVEALLLIRTGNASMLRTERLALPSTEGEPLCLIIADAAAMVMLLSVAPRRSEKGHFDLLIAPW